MIPEATTLSEIRARAAELCGPLGLILVVACFAYVINDDIVTGDSILCLINVVMVIGLYIFCGSTGIFSFGQMSFMGIGAYVSGAFTIPLQMRHILLPHLPGILGTAQLAGPLAILAGAVAAAVIAFVVAIPLMRLNGLAAGIATLAVLQIAEITARNWDDVTGGAASMPGIPRTTDLGFAFVTAVVLVAFVFLFQFSRLGAKLRASRDDEGVAKSIGINVYWHRVIAFVLSAFVVAIGGGLYVHYLGTFSPESFYLGITFTTLAMLVIGGTRSLMGAVLGAVIISTASEGLIGLEQVSSIPNLHEVVLSALMLAVLILRPTGITNGQEFHWSWLAFRRSPR